MKRFKYSYFRFGLILGMGALLATILCIQCVRTHIYTDSVLVPQQAEREAERQMGALTTAARSAGIGDPRALAPVIQHALESSSEHVLWMRLLDTENHLLAQAGSPIGTAKVPQRWWERVQKHESLGSVVDTPAGRAFVTMLPFRVPRPPRPPEAGGAQPDRRFRPGDGGPDAHGIGPRRVVAFVLELAIPLSAVSSAFDGLRENLIVGLIASLALLVSLAVIGLRTRQYLRGRYLESELQLARRVQSDLLPKPHPVSPHVVFAASAIAADHVGGDFHDIFETGSGKVVIVLGDVSGKGVSAALLASVLQGAIRSSMAYQHESACERINHMLCERTAGARFATLFWGVFDPATGTLRYINAGHAAPMLQRHGRNRIERLTDGGPVLGLLPMARYSAGTVEIGASDRLVIYSDGINEAMNASEEQFGEDRIEQIVADAITVEPTELCDRIMRRATSFSSGGPAPDDRTLMVVGFPQSAAALASHTSRGASAMAVA